MIKTNVFFDVLDVQVFGPRPPPDAASVLAGVATTDVLGPVYQQWLSFPHFVRPSSPLHLHQSCMKSVFIVHVGCTRCVTSSTDNIMKIHARITLTVEFIRTSIFLFLFYV